MKKLIILSLILLTAFLSYAQNKRIYQITTQATANASYYVIVDDASWANSRKMTISVLNELEKAERVAQDDTIEYYTVLNTDGTWDGLASSYYLQSGLFESSGLNLNLSNGLYILDSIIYNGVLWEHGAGTRAVAQKTSSDSANGNYSVAINRYNESNHTSTFVHGQRAQSQWVTGRYFSSAQLQESKSGSGQGFEIVESVITTSATTDTLTIGRTEGVYLTVPNDAVLLYNIKVTGVLSASSAGGTVGDTYCIELSGAIKNVGGTTAMVGSVDTLMQVNDAGASAWTVTLDANDTDDALHILVTGEASKVINWCGVITGSMTGFRNFDIDN